ncbi:MAG: hypothetical protein AAFX06_17775 [Planctomycetota bacterium]
MRLSTRFLVPVLGLLCVGQLFADHHKSSHKHGPNGGAVIALGDGSHSVELLCQGGQVVTARVMDKEMKPVAATKLTLTFTEPDGEKEDYAIEAKGNDGVFERKSGHVVMHVMRDKMSVKATIDGKELASKTLSYPHGPNGGEVFKLGDSKLKVELVIDGDVVRLFVLNARKRPAQVDAKEITLVFTESDGEKEDYTIPVGKIVNKGTVFELDDDHVVKHIKRDETMIRLAAGGGTVSSKTFKYSGH